MTPKPGEGALVLSPGQRSYLLRIRPQFRFVYQFVYQWWSYLSPATHWFCA